MTLYKCRSLGPEFGGAVGLMFTLANSIAASMYVIGFCESLLDVLSQASIPPCLRVRVTIVPIPTGAGRVRRVRGRGVKQR